MWTTNSNNSNRFNSTESGRKEQLTVRLDQEQLQVIEDIQNRLGVSKAKAVRLLLNKGLGISEPKIR